MTWEQGALLWWGGMWCEIILGRRALGVYDPEDQTLAGCFSRAPDAYGTRPQCVLNPEEWEK